MLAVAHHQPMPWEQSDLSLAITTTTNTSVSLKRRHPSTNRCDAHKKVEANRRNKLKSLTSSLLSQLPQLHSKSTQSEIFEEAAHEILRLREELRRMDGHHTLVARGVKRQRVDPPRSPESARNNSTESSNDDWTREIDELFAAPTANRILDAACDEASQFSLMASVLDAASEEVLASGDNQGSSECSAQSQEKLDQSLDEDLVQSVFGSIQASSLLSAEEIGFLSDDALFKLVDVDANNLIPPA